MTDKLENFERAFGDGSSGMRTCECGKTYFDDYNSGYGWEDGELEDQRYNAGFLDGQESCRQPYDGHFIR